MKKGLAIFFFCWLISGAPCAAEQLDGRCQVVLEGLGTFILEIATGDGHSENSQLVLQKPGGMREIIDIYEGLLPADLRKFDLDSDNSQEIIALLKHPDGKDVMPHLYSLKENFQRLYPPGDQQENAPLICREFVLTANDNIPLLCARNPVVFHDFGPPDLFQIEFYRLDHNRLELFDKSYSNGNHFNILMNRGAIAFNEGKYLEAIDFYDQAISSSTGEISSKAFIEAIFFIAEARKLTKDFSGALQLYQKIVLEFSQNHRTDQAQKEMELISSCASEPEALSYFIDVTVQVNANQWELALKMLENRPQNSSLLEDRFLFMKAEILAAQNRVDKALEVFANLKERFPESNLADEVDRLMQDMLEDPQEANGL